MAWIEEHQALAFVALLAVIALVVIVRYGVGFRGSVKALGGEVEVEGKGHPRNVEPAKTAASASPSAPNVMARGERNVAIGGNADGSTIITGDGHKLK